MSAREDIDFTTLNWVKQELDETLKQARQALEAFVEDTSDTSQMRFCATYLHQVQGTLRMVELYGAALVVEEMEAVALALLEETIEKSDYAFQSLMQGIVQLPDYLERLQSGHRDIPVVLLPLLNSLREARGEEQLSETILFSPDLAADLPESAAGPSSPIAKQKQQLAAAKLRKAFESFLLKWFKSDDGNEIVTHMQAILDKLVSFTHDLEARRLWWVGSGVLDAVLSDHLEVTKQLKMHFGKVDQAIKRMALKGEQDFADDPPSELTKGLLYYVAQASAENPRASELKQLYHLDELLPDAQELEHARGAMAGHNRELLTTVSASIKEDLLKVKDALDLKLRQNDTSSAGYESLMDTLDRTADTLGMLGLGVPRKVVSEQHELLGKISKGESDVTEAALLDVAGSLLYVESSLDDHIEMLGSAAAEEQVDGDSATPDLPRSEIRRILDQLMKEASANLQEIKQSIVEFIEAPWDHERVRETPTLLDEIVGALRMLDLEEAAELLRGVVAYTQIELLTKKNVPDAEQLDTLADAVASIEYYLEAVREHRPNRNKILEVARRSLDQLGYSPEAAAAAMAEFTAQQEAEAAETEAAEAEAAAEAAAAAPEAAVDSDGAAEAKAAPVSTEFADDIDEEIREVFIEEVEEELSSLDELFPKWQGKLDDEETLTTIRRTFHTLKGSGRLVGAVTLGEFAWHIENMLNRVLDKTIEASPAVVAIMDHTVAALPQLLEQIKGAGAPTADIEGIKSVAERLSGGEEAWLDAAAAPEVAEEAPAEIEAEPTAAESAPEAEPEIELTLDEEPAAEAEPEIELTLDEEPAAEAEPEIELTFDEEPAAEAEPEIELTLDEEPAAEAEPEIELTLDEEPAAEAEPEIELTFDEEATADAEPEIELTLDDESPVSGEPEIELTFDEEEATAEPAEESEIELTLDDLPEAVELEAAESVDTEPVGASEADAADQAAEDELVADSFDLDAEFEPGDALATEGEIEVELPSEELSLDDVIAEESAELDAAPEDDETPEAMDLSGFIDEGSEAESEMQTSDADQISPVELTSEDFSDVDLGDAELADAESAERQAPEPELETAQAGDGEPVEDYAPGVDPVLYDILKSEVASHLGVIRGYLDDARAADEIPPASEELLRAVHTLNGAVAMIDLPDLLAVTGPLEGYVKRLKLHNAAPTDEGLAAVDVCAGVVDQVVETLKDPQAERPDTSSLGENLQELRDSLPEPPDLASTLFSVDEEAPAADLQIEAEAEPEAPIEAGTDGEAQAAEAQAEAEARAREEEARAKAEEEARAKAEEEARAKAEEEARAKAEEEARAKAEEEARAKAEEEARAKAEEEARAKAEEEARVKAEEEARAKAEEEARVKAEEEARAKAEEEARAKAEEEASAEAAADAELSAEAGAISAAAIAAISKEETTVALSEIGDVDDELLDIFLEEGVELLDASDRKMNDWRDNPEDREAIVELQRNLHTLKGGARMAGIFPIGDLSHVMESLFEGMVDDQISISTPAIGVLEGAFDRLHQMVERVSKREAIPTANTLIAQIEALISGKASAIEPTDDRPLAEEESDQPEDATPQDKDKAADETAVAEPVAEEPKKKAPTRAKAAKPTALDEQETQRGAPAVRPQQELIRVRADLLDNLVNYAGEVSIYRSRLEQQIGTFRFNLVEFDQTVTRLREQLRKLELETEAQIIARFQREVDETDEAFDPLEMDRFSSMQTLSRALAESVSDLVSIQGFLDDLTRQSETLLLQQSRVSSDLQEGLMRTRMVPFDSLVPRLRRILRQTTRELGKQAHLKVEGAHGEMDRTVLERITAPLEHMLRNAVAHGLETPADRSKAGKDEDGVIMMVISREATEVVIRVTDDGAGIDPERVREKAIERGLLKADAELSADDLYGFILESGFSTAETVSKVAGRGVGMDVVGSEIKQLGGSLEIASKLGQGTTFTIRLPFTLAVTHAIMVKLGENTFAVPLSTIQGVVRMRRSEFDERIETGDTNYEYTGQGYQLKELTTLLGIERSHAPEDDMVPVLMARVGDQRAAIRVDSVMGSREIVVKSVGPQIASVPGIFGATILGDGSVIMILDLGPLIRRGAALQLTAEEAEEAEEIVAERPPIIMVIDDSITMRKVTSRVLQRNDMDVLTAKDGLDAVEQLQEHLPDLMLLDIEMPRMDGYEVATHVRSDSRLRDIPIIMITSRTGEKHRQRAMDIGVNRYLGKPYQEQDLMQNVRELLEETTVGTD